MRFLPTGKGIVISVTPTPLIDDSYTRIKVRVVGLDGSARRTIDNPGKLGKVLPGPDGKTIAMISAADLNDPAAGRLMVTRTDAALRDLLPEFEGHIADFAWQDDKTLVYIADSGIETCVNLVDIKKCVAFLQHSLL